MPSPSPQPRSPLRTHTARVKTKTPVNQLRPGHREGLDDETKTSDFPVEGELFLLTSPFIEHVSFCTTSGDKAMESIAGLENQPGVAITPLQLYVEEGPQSVSSGYLLRKWQGGMAMAVWLTADTSVYGM
jgi:hypothetical protein